MEKQKSFRGAMEKQKSFRGVIEKQLSFRGVMEKQKSFRIAMEKQQSFRDRRKSRESPGKRGDSEFHLSARTGNLNRVKEILQECKNSSLEDSLSRQNLDGETALYNASENGHVLVVKELLKHSDLETASLPAKNGYDAFHVAAKHGHIGVGDEEDYW
ncbi:ankyrin repeat-containing protein At5g02620-like [Macadamia integrifolia]|uniref:ankyrin repeat-containing protein At5g02620-like n=1 Tax=Macadamia integrifolia TaxID=60698 RepID=UPI001C4F04E8|nr:ankyrin repeat-containing protein At5g02620-like [Macadamia integrifolia]